MSAVNSSPALQYPLPDTPFETVLDRPISAFSNDIDADILNEILNTAESRRSALFQEIEGVSSRLQQLREQHDNFNKFIERHRRLQPAVQRLPVNVLEIIFMQCTMLSAEEEEISDEDSGSEETEGSDEGSDEMSDEDPVVDSSSKAIQVENDAGDDAHSDNTSENSNPDDDSESEITEASKSGVDDGSSIESAETYMEPHATSQPPWIFTHICRHWREVALSCPRIWATFSVSVNLGGLRGMRSTSLPLLRRQLRNTASWPLKFEFFAHEDDPTSQLFLNTLAAHANQWEGAQFYLPLSLLESINHVSGQFQRLKTLDITTVGLSVYSETIDTFLSAPQLKEFRFCSSFTSSALMQELTLLLPPNQITRFSLRTTQQNHLLSINLIKTSVEYIELMTFDEDKPQQTVESLGFSVIELPRLQAMAITAVGDTPGALLDFLSAPSLHTLSIDGSTSLLAVSDFIRRSSASLTSLTIHSNVHLPSLLEATHDLVELDLSTHTDNDINSLKCLLDNVLLPRLKTLTLRVTWSRSSADLRTILAVVNARSRPPTTCHVMFDCEVPDFFSEEVENLSHMEGCSLTWKYIPVVPW